MVAFYVCLSFFFIFDRFFQETLLTMKKYLLSQKFSKYFPIGSPSSIRGRSALRYADGPSGSVWWSRW